MLRVIYNLLKYALQTAKVAEELLLFAIAGVIGAWYFFDNKILRSIRAYKLLIAAVSDGKYIIPLRCTFMFAKELFKDTIESKDSMVIKNSKGHTEDLPYIQNYRGRWSIEKMIRTSKQSLAVQNCFSTNVDTQLNHMAAVLFAFSLTQLEMQCRHLKTPEQALRALNRKKFNFLKQYFYRSLASYH